MQRLPTIAAAAVALLLGAPAGAEEVATRTIEDSVAVDPRQPLQVVVDNVFGSIRVTAHDDGRVELRAVETIRGDTAADIARARDEVALRTESGDGFLAFRVRQIGDGCDCHCVSRWDGYTVTYDIDLAVPREVALDLSTVNGGDVTVAGVHGPFEVANVNGSVTLHGLRSEGRAQTVNGRVEASFEQSPTGPTRFRTVNGPIDVAFPTELSADLAFETTHGAAWTDFDVEPLPVMPVEEHTGDGDPIRIRTSPRSMVRAGAGGPLLTFETLNGDISVRKLTVW